MTRRTVLRTGKLRDAGPGRRGWRVKLYAAGGGYPSRRVVYKDQGRWTYRVPADGDGNVLFEQVEAALDAQVALGAHDASGQRRDLNALADRYLQWLAAAGRADNYLEKVTNILDVWVRPAFGALPVSEWSPTHSAGVIAAARAKGLSASRIEDIGMALSGLRTTAHRKPRWLHPTDDPLDGVRFTRSSTTQGVHRNYVPRRLRPPTDAVLSAVLAATVRGAVLGSDWLGLQVAVAGFMGLRFGEQMALRACDVHLDRWVVDVTGAWCQPRNGKRPYRKAPKNGKQRWVPIPGALRGPLAARVEQLLRAGQPQAVLFPNPRTGLPWTREAWNEEWHRITRLTTVLPTPWPTGIPYRNLRHHTATWLNETVGFTWVDIAAWLGHDYATCLAYYVLPSSDAEDRARDRLTNF